MLSRVGLSCGTCGHRRSLEELRRDIAAKDAPPPTLAERWADALEGYLTPDPYLLRPSDSGMGRELDRLCGGGLTVGQTVALVSHGAGVGKTALLHQWLDGVAARSAEQHAAGGPISPVVMVTEMSERDVTIRALARQAGVPGYVLRDPRGPVGSRHIAGGETEGMAALIHASRAAERARSAMEHMTVIDRSRHVSVADLGEIVRRVRAFWEAQGVEVPAVVLGIDPLHRMIDLTRPEAEGIGQALTELLNLAQRERVIVIMTSDTTKGAASARGAVGGLQKSEDLAAAVEMAFRGSYQLLHLPDVALGLVTMRADDEHLSADDRARLAAQPEGTLYAELASAKSRWHSRGERAAYWLDPAMFRYRVAAARQMPRKEPDLEERILEYIAANPGCSEAAVRRDVKGGTHEIRKALHLLIRAHRIEDRGGDRGRELYPAWHRDPQNPHTAHSTGAVQGSVQGVRTGRGDRTCTEGLPLSGESPPSRTGSPGPSGRYNENGRAEEVDDLFEQGDPPA